MNTSLKEKKPLYINHRKRLKKKFTASGIDSLHDYEVLELLLTFAIHRKDVKPIAKELISRFGGFHGVLDASVQDISLVPGLGEHSAVLIKLVRACSDLYLKKKLHKRDVLSSPDDVLRYCTSAMARLGVEQFRVMYLNAKNEVISDEIIQEGTVDQTAVYPRKIMEHALKIKSAAAILCVHNHPSGDPAPSHHDKVLTNALQKAAEALGIKLHDHIIIGTKGYFSFKQDGLLF